MKNKLTLASIFLIVAFSGFASAKERSYPQKVEGGSWLPRSFAMSTSMIEKLPYENIAEASRWSKLPVGKALTASLSKKRAHGAVPQDDPDALFALTKGGECGWSCCFKTCMNSAMYGTGTLCLGNCTACGLTGSTWACAICAGCGAVGFAAMEFCGLHCCVEPGC